MALSETNRKGFSRRRRRHRLLVLTTGAFNSSCELPFCHLCSLSVRCPLQLMGETAERMGTQMERQSSGAISFRSQKLFRNQRIRVLLTFADLVHSIARRSAAPSSVRQWDRNEKKRDRVSAVRQCPRSFCVVSKRSLMTPVSI